MFGILANNLDVFLGGLCTTLAILLLVTALGAAIGIPLGVIGSRSSKQIGYLIQKLRFITRVIPVLVLLFWFHYPLQAILSVVIPPFWTSVAVLSLINIIAISSLVRIELVQLPKQYREAAMTLGLNSRQTIRHVELPILYRRLLPRLLEQTATMLEYTLFASLISVNELFRVAQSLNAMLYKPVEIYTLLVLFFFIILTPLYAAANYLKKKYRYLYDSID